MGLKMQCNKKFDKRTRPEWLKKADTLNPVQFIEYLHMKKPYKNFQK